MRAAQRPVEVPHHVAEGQSERRPPANQHVIVAGAKLNAGGEPHHLAQPALDAVALDRIADLPRHREADPRRTGFVAPPRLEDKCL